uniref:Uncharacterized protein n=1 Tax=Oryza glumipatula TaxID=40148 RepID=A0A0E0A4K3_9ORYZ
MQFLTISSYAGVPTTLMARFRVAATFFTSLGSTTLHCQKNHITSNHLDESTGLEAAGDGEHVGSGHDEMSKRRVELHHGPHLARILLLHALEQLLELLLSSTLKHTRIKIIHIICH